MGLFKPGWMSADYGKAELALQRVKRQAVLCRAAREAVDMRIRRMAVERMNDFTMLMSLADDMVPEGIRERAVFRLLEIEPFAGAWRDICMTNGRAAINNALLQDCLACVSRYRTAILRRKAAGYVTDQALLKWLYENDKDEAVRVNALIRIEDQDYLQAVFDAADSEDLRLCIAVYMQNPASAAWLARNTEKPDTCIKALRKTGDKALALEIMEQTLNQSVLCECTELITPEDLEDDRQLAVMVLCGPEEVRKQAKSRIQDFAVLERIAMHDGPERFPSGYQMDFLCCDALKYVSGDEALLRVHLGAKDSQISEKALLRIGRLDTLLSLFEDNPKRYSDKSFFERLDVIDGNWVQVAGSRTVEGLARILSENTAEERFEYTHIAQALKRIYGLGRATKRIAGLQGIAVSHVDASGRMKRDKGCHMDGGFTYLELDGIEPVVNPVIFKLRNNRDPDDALQDLEAVTNQMLLKEIALDSDVASRIRAAAARRITDEYTLVSVALEIEMPEKQDFNLHTIKDPDMLLLIASDAKGLRIRKQALRRIHDAKTLFRIVSANVPKSFTPEICERLNELDADWAQQLDDTAVKALIDVIADNEKDEKFDYRHFAAALKSIYMQGRSKAAIAELHGKAVAHLDFTGKEYRDKWCHQDGDYVYMDLLEPLPVTAPERRENNVSYYDARIKRLMEEVEGLKNTNRLKAIALDVSMPLEIRMEAIRRIEDEAVLCDIALEIERADMNLMGITDKDKLLVIARDAKALQTRRRALQRITDAKALFQALISDMPRTFTPEICTRLNELDAGWAQQLSDEAIGVMISVIAENEKDEQFDYRPMAMALKRVYFKGRFTSAIKGLEGKVISHVDVQGKAYRDEWCHSDEGYTYFNLTNEV